jgi:hypothetical protein
MNIMQSFFAKGIHIVEVHFNILPGGIISVGLAGMS